MQNIDPRILQALLGQQGTFNANGQTQEYIDPTTGLPYTLMRNYAQGSGDAGMVDRSQLMPGEIVAGTGQRNNLGYNLQNVYDQQGNFLRQDDDGSGFGAFGDFVGDNMGAILAAIATMGVASAAGGTLGAGAEAGAGGWADWAASELTGAAANPATAAQLNAWAAGSALPYAGGAAAGGDLAGMAGQRVGVGNMDGLAGGDLSGMAGQRVGVGSMDGLAGGGGSSIGGGSSAMADFDPSGITDPNFGKNASFGGTTSVGGLGGPISAGGGSMDWLSTLGQLAGAAAGAYGSRDQQQTQSRDPWGPAQPALKGLLDQLQTLQQQYQQNPVSPLMGQAYGNQFGLLNAANQGASGMLAGMQANAGGQNSYSRQNKGRSLVGSNPVWNWTPGLLNMGG